MKDKFSELADSLTKEFNLISDERKSQLQNLSFIISSELKEFGHLDLTVICTHNSRRSQLGEIWFREAAKFYGIDGLYSFSGGTEATAFNYRMVKALREQNCPLEVLEDGENPLYFHQMGDVGFKMFSKKYNDEFNPQSGFLAVMVCDHADEACPIVIGAKHRFSLQFKDPKAYDDTELESEKYQDKIFEIGREVLYCLNLVR